MGGNGEERSYQAITHNTLTHQAAQLCNNMLVVCSITVSQWQSKQAHVLLRQHHGAVTTTAAKLCLGAAQSQGTEQCLPSESVGG